ncbi:MAG: tetratricopeptide repeat protein [Armatimonadota bacterium]
MVIANKSVIASNLAQRQVRLVVCVLLATTTFAIYFPVLGYGLVNFDDHFYVTKNPHVRSGLSIKNILWAVTTFTESNWHPLTWISLQLDCTLGFKDGHVLHLTNVLFHIANTLLLFLVLEVMTGSMWRSAFVAALFAVHPLRVESVAWVSERKDVLSTFFGMLTILAYAWWLRKPSPARYVLAIVLYILGLLSKPMLVSMPILLLLLDLWPLARFNFDSLDRNRLCRLLGEKLPFIVLAAGSCVVTYVAQLKGGAVGRFEYYPLGVRLSNAVVSYVAYIIKAICPVRLAVFYPHPETTIPTWQVVVSAVLLIGISFTAIRNARIRSYFFVGWFWYVISLLPVIGIVQVGLQGMADRYTYVPMIGVFIIVAWGVPELFVILFGRGAGSWLFGSAVVLICILSVLAHRQVHYWRDDFSLFGHAIRVTKRNALAHTHLGLAYEGAGKYDEALKHYYIAVRANPEYSPAHTCLGDILLRRGRVGEAFEHFRRAVLLSPGIPETHHNLGLVLLRKRDWQAAIEAFQQATRLRRDYADAYNGLAIALAKQGRLREAVENSARAVRLSPRNVRFRRVYASLLAESSDLEGARRQYQVLVRLNPSDVESRFELGRLLLSLGDSASARKELMEVLRLRPDLAEAHVNLAIALYDLGRYRDAWAHVHAAQKQGVKVHPGFIAALRAKMPTPAVTQTSSD